MTWEVNDPEPCDLIALLDCPGDRHCPTVPRRHQPPEQKAAVRGQPREVEVRPEDLGGLRCVELGRMAVGGSIEAQRRAAVVGIRVAEDDALDPAQAGRGGSERVCHVRDPGVEHGHATVVLEEVDVHRPHRKPAPHDPHALRDPLGLGAVRPGTEPGARVGQLGEARLALGSRRRQHSQLPRYLATVQVSVVVLDLVVAGRDHVASLDV